MFREYLFYSVTLVHAPISHGELGGSGSHDHGKVAEFMLSGVLCLYEELVEEQI